MKSRTEQFLVELKKEITFFTSPDSLRITVGDSISNNRVPTVSQVIRYLRGNVFDNSTGRQLSAVYRILLSRQLLRKVRRNNNRTDAYDINEFFTVVNRYVLKNPALKGQVSKAVNQAATF